MNDYLKSSDEVLLEQQTQENGLSSKDAEERLLKVGRNKLAEAKKHR